MLEEKHDFAKFAIVLLCQLVVQKEKKVIFKVTWNKHAHLKYYSKKNPKFLKEGWNSENSVSSVSWVLVLLSLGNY